MLIALLHTGAQEFKTVVRDSKGQLVKNSNASIKIEILKESAYGPAIFAEVHQAVTDNAGGVVLTIGEGKALHGDISAVAQSQEGLFLKIYIDLNGGVSFMEMEPELKTTIPYALYAGCFPMDNRQVNEPEVTEEADENAVTDYDGNVYTTVEIGNQAWLAQNLRSAHYADGTPIKGAFDYNDDASLAEEFGKLYTWAAAMRGAASNNSIKSSVQGACPDGFHLPSEKEWAALVDNAGAKGAVGGRKLKVQGTEYWEQGNGTNETGFSAPGGGFLQKEGASYGNLRKQCFFWSATENSPVAAKIFMLYDSGLAMPNHSANKQSGRSVRCVKD